MYNKDVVIETLLEKSAPSTEAPSTSVQSVAAHVKSLRDVKTLTFTENPAWLESSTVEKGDGYIDMLKSRWICPVGGQEMNGRFRFVFIWTCGCVFSERALKEMSKNKQESATTECPKCQKPFEMLDVILLNPTEGVEIDSLQEKMKLRRAAAKEAKKGKKRQNKNETETATSSETVPTVASTSSEAKKIQNGSVPPTASTSSNQSNGLKSSGLPARKAGTEPVGPKDSKIAKGSKLNGSYSVRNDPNVSDTYKSLFTSSEKAKEQQKAHWVTYNPFYN
jgi:hypothetical protein